MVKYFKVRVIKSSFKEKKSKKVHFQSDQELKYSYSSFLLTFYQLKCPLC